MNLDFRITSDIDIADTTNPQVRSLHALWLAKHSGGRPPTPEALDWRALDCARDLMLVVREGARYRYLAYGENIVRASGFDLTGKTTDELRSEAGAFFVRCYDRALDEGCALFTVNPALHAALVLSWERLLLPLCNEAGEPRYVLTLNRPRAFRHQLLTAVLDGATDAIIGLGTAHGVHESGRLHVVAMNTRAEALLGPRENAIGRALDDLVANGAPAFLAEPVVREALSSASEQAVEWQVGGGQGHAWYRIDARQFDGGGVVTATDITALKNAEHELKRLATTDPLTGVFNRRHFMSALDTEVSRARREGTRLALIMIDIDHFKRVNDKHGHAAGDAVLNGLTTRLRQRLRTHDVLARLGGEEFGVLLPSTGLRETQQIAERMRAMIASEPFVADGKILRVSCSLGIAELLDGMSGEALLNVADTALYEAKHGGRNRIRIA